VRTKDFRSLPPIAQEDLRRKAVQAVLDGTTRSEAGKRYGVSRKAVEKWVVAYEADGTKALRANPRGRPRGGSLHPWQSSQIVRSITDRCPDQVKLPFMLWTREAVALLIKRRFGISISIWTAGRYLAKWGFTPQKPVRRAYERNPQEVERWMKERYPRIKYRAKAEGATIFWGDEMGLRSDHAFGRTYAKRGQTPVVPGTGQRFGCNMISAITNKGHLVFMVFKAKFNSTVLINFMRRLIQQNRKKVYLVIDSHPAHRSKRVLAWVAKKRQFLSVFFLPGYSPELNPDELLNQDVKANALGRKRARDQRELLTNIRGFLRRKQKHPRMVRNYFREQHVRYAA
jgi:transposase